MARGRFGGSFRFGAWAAGLLWFLALTAPGFARPAPAPATVYGRLPAIGNVAVSPDGRKLAITRFVQQGQAVQIVDLENSAASFTYSIEADNQLRTVQWVDNGRIAVLISRTFSPNEVLPGGVRFVGAPRRVDYYRYALVDLATRDSIWLTTNREDAWADQGSELIAPIAGSPDAAIMIGRAPGVEISFPTVYRVALRTNRVRNLSPEGINADTRDFLIDEVGAVIAREDVDDATNTWRIFVYDGERPRLLLSGETETGDPSVALQGLTLDGRLAALGADAAGEFTVLYAFDRSTAARTVLFQQPNVEVDDAILDPWTRRVVGVAWTATERQQQFFDPALKAIYDAAVQRVPGVAHQLVSWSQDRAQAVIYVEEGQTGGSYYLFGPASQRVTLVGHRYPEIFDTAQGDRQSISYRARDGQRIPAYLTLPPGVDTPRGLPLVLLVHGGPGNGSRDTMDFDWWAGFLASRGYMVLQPNFRGSGGYGVSWERAGHGQWGGLMQTDVEDGVAALVRSGAVDPARVCIVGASYGGYAALAGATLTPDRYRCAASIAGLSDLRQFLTQRQEQSGGADSAVSDYWRLSIGDRSEDRARIDSVSPIRLVAQVRIPILLLHGTDDTVVSIEQSRRMHRALLDAGKTSRLVELQGDDHWLSDAATRVQMLQELEGFLAEHLAPAAAP